MKTYEEMVNDLFKRRKIYLKKQKKRKTVINTVSLLVLCVCLISTLTVLALQRQDQPVPAGTTSNFDALNNDSSDNSNSADSSRPDYMKDPNNLYPATALKLREDYLRFLKEKHGLSEEYELDSISVQKFFGNYSGCEVVYMGSPLTYTDAERPVEIAGYTIVFPNGQEVYAYKDSNFYTIKEAFDAGLITTADIYDIGKQVGIGFIEQYPNKPKYLDSEMALKLREDYLRYLKEKYGLSEKYKLDSISVQEYFGNYSGFEVVYMGAPIPHTQAERPVEIAGYTIIFPSGQEVYAYKDSKFYTIKEAFDAGLITKVDVYDIGKQVGVGFSEQYPNP